jgi:hypothetical protein
VLGGRAPGRTGAVDLALAAMRAVELDGPCLECQRAINTDQLHDEQLSETERRNQRYVDASGEYLDRLEAPSVISLNSLSAGLAMTEFQAEATGLLPPGSRGRSRFFFPTEGELRDREHTRRVGCRFCDSTSGQSLLARGDDARLPLRRGAAPIPKRTIRDRLLRALRR